MKYAGLFVLSLAVIAITLGGGYLIYTGFDDPQARSAFGEMFGAVDTLFSGLAFAGVIYAILLQQRELELQRSELTLTRAELRRAAEAQERSEKALAEQVRLQNVTAQMRAIGSIIEQNERQGPGRRTGQTLRMEQDELFSQLKRLVKSINPDIGLDVDAPRQATPPTPQASPEGTLPPPPKRRR